MGNVERRVNFRSQFEATSADIRESSLAMRPGQQDKLGSKPFSLFWQSRERRKRSHMRMRPSLQLMKSAQATIRSRVPSIMISPQSFRTWRSKTMFQPKKQVAFRKVLSSPSPKETETKNAPLSAPAEDETPKPRAERVRATFRKTISV